LALGGDLGGTSTRIVVVGPDGREHGAASPAAATHDRSAGAAAAFGDALRRVVRC
jgi:hypothetical protein